MKFPSLIRRLDKGPPLLAVLVDPDKYRPEVISGARSAGVSCFLVGGSELSNGNVHNTIGDIKKLSDLPVLLFPGDETQLTPRADGLLLLSLLSGRNPDYLIEKHIRAAPMIRKMKLPHVPTAYLLIGSGRSTTQRVTNTTPISPRALKEIRNTAMAAEQLGFRAIYLEGGSGASLPVAPSIIRLLKKNVSLPLIVGGGLNSPRKVADAIRAGAGMVVIGNALETDISLLPALGKAFHEAARRLKHEVVRHNTQQRHSR